MKATRHDLELRPSSLFFSLGSILNVEWTFPRLNQFTYLDDPVRSVEIVVISVPGQTVRTDCLFYGHILLYLGTTKTKTTT